MLKSFGFQILDFLIRDAQPVSLVLHPFICQHILQLFPYLDYLTIMKNSVVSWYLNFFLEIEPMVSHMLGIHFTTKLHLQSFKKFYFDRVLLNSPGWP